MARRGKAGRGKASVLNLFQIWARLGRVRPGMARQGMARHGAAWRGEAIEFFWRGT